MAAPGLEQERQLTPEEIAAGKVESYLERIEKKPEIDSDVAGVVKSSPAGVVQLPAPITDDQGQVVMSQTVTEPEIDLPLTEPEIRDGLHHKVIDAVRWLAEFCIYLIKKYPGRVFYRREE